MAQTLMPMYLIIDDSVYMGTASSVMVKECELCFAIVREEKLQDHMTNQH